jgi:hypothetical protein
MENILVDEIGKITAILDWECVSATPVWVACQPPKFLDGPVRNVKPDSSHYYRPPTPNELESLDMEGQPSVLDELYWEHLEDYERGVLRALYLGEMDRIIPQRMEQYRACQAKLDFHEATTLVDVEWHGKDIRSWIQKFGTSEAFSLSERLTDPA